jgi:hypothetical protein
MIEIFENTKVFVYCPSKVVTGGAELLHQLVHTLNEGGRAAYIVYYDDMKAPVPVEYQQYNLNQAQGVEDSAENILVLYEAIFDMYNSMQHCQLVLWWLSVDNFYICSKGYLAVSDYLRWEYSLGLKVFASRMLQFLKGHNLFKSTVSLKQLSKLPVINCYQSEYAQHFLLSKGFSEILPLKDFINHDFYKNNTSVVREDKILYNPKKGFEFTRKLIANTPHLKWVPLENMTRAELLHEFQTSKLYIDFGYHPGKDRIPREAAMNGCCVITNRKGSAKYFEDVRIYNAYKLDEQENSISDIMTLIKDILNNYTLHAERFDFYRQEILKEKDEFVKQVHRLFRMIDLG